MAKSGRFGGLKANLAPKAETAPAAPPSSTMVDRLMTPKAKAREGKRAIAGYFSDGLSRELRMLSIQEGTSVQALLGEAIDLLLRDRGKHPFGER